MKNILITGGLGYIGSHACVVFIEAGYKVMIVDNLSNSCRTVLERIINITGVEPAFYEGDICDLDFLARVFLEARFDGVIHFAGLKVASESLDNPGEYYNNNVNGTINLLTSMKKAGISSLIFSSSANIYGEPETLPISENSQLSATNPYGRTKLIIEGMLSDISNAEEDWKIACLRYFNPVGAHESGCIGEDPKEAPSNLMPFLAQVATGRRNKLYVFGGDYPTPDGSGVRDFIHVMDLVEGHLAAWRYCQNNPGLLTVNLGTGRGVSVLEMIQAFERASGQRVEYEIVGRRPGDVAQCWADPSLARQLLNWSAKRSLGQMCIDTLRWQKLNPTGYIIE